MTLNRNFLPPEITHFKGILTLMLNRGRSQNFQNLQGGADTIA